MQMKQGKTRQRRQDARKRRQRHGLPPAGRVLTTPTYAKGRLVFGARDGRVYVVDARTGELAWRFFAAPEGRHILVDAEWDDPPPATKIPSTATAPNRGPASAAG